MAIWKYKNSLLPVIVSIKTKLRVNNKTIATNNIGSSRSEPRHLRPCDGLCASNHSAKSSFVKRSDVSGTAWLRATSNAFYFTFEFKLTFGPGVFRNLLLLPCINIPLIQLCNPGMRCNSQFENLGKCVYVWCVYVCACASVCACVHECMDTWI